MFSQIYILGWKFSVVFFISLNKLLNWQFSLIIKVIRYLSYNSCNKGTKLKFFFVAVGFLIQAEKRYFNALKSRILDDF